MTARSFTTVLNPFQRWEYSDTFEQIKMKPNMFLVWGSISQFPHQTHWAHSMRWLELNHPAHSSVRQGCVGAPLPQNGCVWVAPTTLTHSLIPWDKRRRTWKGFVSCVDTNACKKDGTLNSRQMKVRVSFSGKRCLIIMRRSFHKLKSQFNNYSRRLRVSSRTLRDCVYLWYVPWLVVRKSHSKFLGEKGTLKWSRVCMMH